MRELSTLSRAHGCPKATGLIGWLYLATTTGSIAPGWRVVSRACDYHFPEGFKAQYSHRMHMELRTHACSGANTRKLPQPYNLGIRLVAKCPNHWVSIDCFFVNIRTLEDVAGAIMLSMQAGRCSLKFCSATTSSVLLQPSKRRFLSFCFCIRQSPRLTGAARQHQSDGWDRSFCRL